MTAVVVLTSHLEAVADATVAALREAGRPDLAELVQFFEDDTDAWCLEPLDDVSDDDFAVMSKAVRVAIVAVDHAVRLDRAFGPVQEGGQQ